MTRPQVTTLPEAPKVQPTAGGGKGRELVRHIVKLDANGNPLDECLCGYVWDRVFLSHGKEICQECVEILKRNQREGRS